MASKENQRTPINEIKERPKLTCAGDSSATVPRDARTSESTRSSRCAHGTGDSIVVRSPSPSCAIVYGRTRLPVTAVPSVTAARVGSRASVGARGIPTARVPSIRAVIDRRAGGPSAIESSVAGAAEGSRSGRGAGGIGGTVVRSSPKSRAVIDRGACKTGPIVSTYAGTRICSGASRSAA